VKDPQWHCHAGNRVFGRELEPGEVIDIRDVYASNRLGWFATTFPGERVPDGKRYIRPFPAPKWYLLREQRVYGRLLVPGERLLTGDVIANGVYQCGNQTAILGEIVLGGMYVRPMTAPA
jgi:hypothetical protein